MSCECTDCACKTGLSQPMNLDAHYSREMREDEKIFFRQDALTKAMEYAKNSGYPTAFSSAQILGIADQFYDYMVQGFKPDKVPFNDNN